ncbi:hypothetical protein PRIPAC_87796 [Pristionchus pacificus]|uniref:Uncharacterized protein n=1 Tax=Pristionchus pacificus TaxID=54126 RepID=A0A2A6CVU6_PRIPA|nr:hypothetical protein PRIPAC_87796 [Pristionchus pacificus]|eukprot:PDM82167.1 hypothetical protein PRIPAC_36560 [Pristionchus pacificus]
MSLSISVGVSPQCFHCKKGGAGTDADLRIPLIRRLSFSVIRIAAYIACAIYALRYRPNCNYQFNCFGFILILEALLHFTQFLIEMLTDASSPGALCSILILFTQYLHFVLIPVYVYYLLLLFRVHKPFSLPLLGLIAFITNLMIVGALIEIVGLCAVFTHPCTTSFESFKRGNGSEKAEFFTALTVAVAVRIPLSILLIASQNQIFLPLLVQVVLRALPIAFPLVITLILWNAN